MGVFARILERLAAAAADYKTIMIPLGTSLSRCPAGQRMPLTSRRIAQIPACGWKRGQGHLISYWETGAMTRTGSGKPLETRELGPVFRDGSCATNLSNTTSGDTRDATAPLVTLLRNALSASDRDFVRTLERLGSCRHPQ